MKGKILVEKCNKETGISEFTFQNKYGHFSGQARCHPSDMKDVSEFSGIRYATSRAAAQHAKLRMKQEKEKLKAIQNLKNDLIFLYKTEALIPPKTKRAINLKLRDYSQSASDWEAKYKALTASVARQDAERQEILSWSKKEKKAK